ncbi:MAG: tRNA (adenosine(37)-N6)-threonylcarbamoyltransferase complex dimerization subunit type 1 TsaB [Gemmatimonadetes bacterium]|nr:tRNA (adenosine(37)-N6)-threonylcarbamoyltransferase complex dimerization subunit type 1 TsaB [Gemmatimonadota bacterium]MCY3942831.1 tRNA (adenosine(37)-N6)-threonylcarbamoyltransferase complex dimerization subunit type 1 TsaB [Gemmatimonadota bacterium]
MTPPAAAPAPRGPVLAIETSWRIGSVALGVDGAVAARRLLTTPRAHSATLIAAIREVLEEEALHPADLAGIAIGSGPGSFTGVRIGAAAAKGFAATLEIPLYPTSTLRAAACAEEILADAADLPPEVRCGSGEPRVVGEGTQPEHRYVLLDARGGRVYGAGYDVGNAGRPVEVRAPHGGTILDVVNARPAVGTVFVGDGALAHESLLLAAGFEVRPAPAGVPLADAVYLCCPWEPVDAAAWEPSYIRQWRPG